MTEELFKPFDPAVHLPGHWWVRSKEGRSLHKIQPATLILHASYIPNGPRPMLGIAFADDPFDPEDFLFGPMLERPSASGAVTTPMEFLPRAELEGLKRDAAALVGLGKMTNSHNCVYTAEISFANGQVYFRCQPHYGGNGLFKGRGPTLADAIRAAWEGEKA